MASFWRDLFGARIWTGLDVNPGSMGIVRFMESSKGPQVVHTSYQTVQNPDRLVEELRSFIQTTGLKSESPVTAIPLSSVSIREIHISFDNKKKLKKIIKYQTEPYLPLPIEDVVVDFLPCSEDDRIWTFSAPKEVLSAHINLLSDAGLAPLTVGISELALYSLFVHVYGKDCESTAAIIYLSPEKFSTLIIARGHVEFIRVLERGSDEPGALGETLKLYALKNPHHPVERIFLTGASACEAAAAGAFSGLTPLEMELWRPFDHFKSPKGEMEADHQSQLSVPLGLAVMSANSISKGINLRKEEFAVETSKHLKRTSIYMVTAICVFMSLFTFHLYQDLNSQEKRYSVLKRETKAFFTEVFPDAGVLVKGQELAQMRMKIEEEKGKFKWLDTISNEGAAMEALLALTKTVSQYSKVAVENISFDEKSLHIDGQAPSFKTVDMLESGLSRLKDFHGAKLMSAKMDNMKKVILFQFILQRKRK